MAMDLVCECMVIMADVTVAGAIVTCYDTDPIRFVFSVCVAAGRSQDQSQKQNSSG